MELVLTTLPVAYVYWACVLMIWSVFSAGLICNIIRTVRNRTGYWRRTDALFVATLLACGILLYATVFMVPHITALFVEIGLVVLLWYTVFLLALTQFVIHSLLRIKHHIL